MKQLACVIFLGLLFMTTFAFAQAARLGSWGVVCASPAYREQFNNAARDPRGIEYLRNSGACVQLQQEFEVSIIGKVWMGGYAYILRIRIYGENGKTAEGYVLESDLVNSGR